MKTSKKSLNYRKAVLLLFLFQYITGILIKFASHFLRTFSLFYDTWLLGMLTIGLSSILYGFWVEKKYPLMIDQYIKKVCAATILTYYVLTLIGAIFLAIKNNLAIHFYNIFVLVLAMSIFYTVGYFMSFSSIKKGMYLKRKAR